MGAIAEQGELLEIAWYRDDGQHRHTVDVVVDGRRTSVLASYDATSDGNNPTSPPIQHVEFPESGVILGVGMSGPNHWSMSVQQVCSTGLEFDVACRVHEPLPFLASTYRPRAGVGRNLCENGKQALMFVLHSISRRLDLTCTNGVLVRYGNDLQFRADCDSSSDVLPVTYRWSYGIYLHTHPAS